MPTDRNDGLARIPALLIACLALSHGLAGQAIAQCPNSPLFTAGTGGTNGWTLVNATTVSAPGSRWVINPGNDPQVWSPVLSCAAASYNYMRIGINNHGTNTSGRVYIDNGTGFAEARSVGFTDPSNPPRDQWITVRLDNISGWTGTITRLRVDPVLNGSGGSDNVDLLFFYWRRDTKPPEFRFSPEPVTVSPAGWTPGAISIAARGQDPAEVSPVGPDIYGSGCKGFNVRIDGGAWTFYPNTFFDDFNGNAAVTIDFPAGSVSNGTHTIQFQAVDVVGRVSAAIETRSFYFDNVAPNTPTINYVWPGGWTSLNAFDFGWTDPGDNASGINRYQYSLDGGPPVDIDGNFFDDLPIFGSGTHTFAVRAVDNAANVGAWSAPVTVYVDDTAPTPVASLAVSPNGFTNTNAFSFTWASSSDAHSGLNHYEYRVNGGAYVSTGASGVSGALAVTEGSNSFEVRAVDNVGNFTDPSPIQFFYYPNYLFPPVARAPADGAGVSLPETFTWDQVPNATGYEIQIGPGGNFSSPWSTTTSSLTSIVVPTGAAPNTGAGYAWRVRALGSDPPSPWSNTPTFVRVTQVSPPTLPGLLSPANDASVPGTTVVFQWAPVSGATSYRLEVSTDPAFGAGAATSWTGQGIAGTSKVVEFSPGVVDLHWRVYAANSAGFGPPSLSRVVHLVPPAPGLISADIVTPASDVNVDLGQPILGSGLIVARSTETVLVEWLLNGEPYFSEQIALSGTGAETSPAPIPTGVLGTHAIQLRVTGSSQILSTVRTIEVGVPGFGAPDHLVLVADRPQLLVNESTMLYATVTDVDGSIVLNDNGRPLRFDAAEGGTVNPSDVSTVGGVAATSYTAPAAEATPSVTVEDLSQPRRGFGTSATPVRGDNTRMGASSTELRRLQAEARDYLNRLGNLYWDNVVGTNGGIRPRSFNVGYALSFVNSRQVGDEPRLRRLNLFLRYVDRAFYHDKALHKHGTQESAPIDGAAVMFADEARSLGQVTVSVFALATAFEKKAQSLPLIKLLTAKAYRLLANTLVGGADLIVKTAIGLANISETEKNVVRNHWKVIKDLARTEIAHNRAQSLSFFVNNPIFVTVLAKWMVDTGFTNPMEARLNAVVSTLAQPGWQGGSDSRAQTAVNGALAEVRAKTKYQHKSLSSILTRISMLQFLNDAQSLLSVLNAPLFVSNILNKFVQNLILWAAGVDCATTGSRIAPFGAWVAGEVTAYQSPQAPMMAVRAVMRPLEREGSEVPRTPLQLTAAHVALAQQAQSRANEFEAAARTLEQALSAADSTTAATTLDAMLGMHSALGDDIEMISSPVYSTIEAGRLELDGATANGLGLSHADALVSNRRTNALGIASEWVETPGSDSLRLMALDSLRSYLEIARDAITGYQDYAPTLLGTLGDPFLVIETPVAPALIPQGVEIPIEVTVRNLGSGTATNVWLEISGAEDEAGFPAGSRRFLGDIPAGGAGTTSWQASLTPVIPEGDSSAIVYMSIAPDSVSALGGSRSVGVTVSSNPNLLASPPPPIPSTLEFGLPIPSPSSGNTTLRFGLPRGGEVALDVYDVAGRRVVRRDLGRFPPGVHSFRWEARDGSGRYLRSGVYVMRLRASGQTRDQRLVLIR